MAGPSSLSGAMGAPSAVHFANLQATHSYQVPGTGSRVRR